MVQSSNKLFWSDRYNIQLAYKLIDQNLNKERFSLLSNLTSNDSMFSMECKSLGVESALKKRSEFLFVYQPSSILCKFQIILLLFVV